MAKIGAVACKKLGLLFIFSFPPFPYIKDTCSSVFNRLQ
ncbi:hypothetical protein bcere0009_15480 [Bacillus cereus R309803]|nr:hypothetical protein bcere0009_15480 [Bacillus cereus R309803]